ncbi:hypothetical protein ABIG06_000851 [Bradyrhizobium sp. USDA 326]
MQAFSPAAMPSPPLAADVGERGKVFRWPDRLLQKHRLCLPACFRERDRLLARQGAVHVDHQRNGWPDRLARGEYCRRRGLVQLDRAIAERQRLPAFVGDIAGRADPQEARVSRNRRAPDLAEQTMQRHAFGLRGQVPQCDIEPGDREHGDAVAAEQMQIALDLFHHRGNAGSIRHLHPAGLRRDHLLDGAARGAGADIGEGIAPAGQPGIGRDLDEHHVERGNRGSTLAEVCDTGVIGDADMMRPHIGDLHDPVPLSRERFQRV